MSDTTQFNALDQDANTAGCSATLEAYYDAQRKEYLIANHIGWIPQTEAQFKRRLRQKGISTKAVDGLLVSPADTEILRVQDYCAVHYAGPLAGYADGIHEDGSLRLLITQGPQLPEPVSGDWSMLRQTVEAVLHDSDHDQLCIFHGWLQVAWIALSNGQRMPGQALAIAGPRGCGKSLLQNIITQVLGGRSAKPYQYMTGGTPFNSDLFKAEHLMIEDEAPSTDFRARRNLGSFIKQLTVNVEQRLHAKGRDAIMLKPFWRVSLTLNDEPEDLLVLPPIDDSLQDKIILFRAHKRELPMVSSTPCQREAFWNRLIQEIPAFLHWLINEFTIPEALQSNRFGITHFHHPALLEGLIECSNETQLLALIDQHVDLPFLGTAGELEAQLRREAGKQADKLLYFSNACGTYLARLAQQPSPRVFKRRSSTQRQWEIFP